MAIDNLGKQYSAAPSAADMLGSVKTVKGTEKGGDNELAGLLSKMSAKFDQNLKATEKIIDAIKASSLSDKSQNKIMKELLTLNEKLAQKGTQNFRKSGGDGSLKDMKEFVKHGLKAGSIYVADVVSHRLLKNIMLQMQGKATDAKLMSKRKVEKIYDKYTGGDAGGGSGGGGGGGGGGSGGGGGEDLSSLSKLGGLFDNYGILADLQYGKLSKTKDLLEGMERTFFGLNEKTKSFSESFFGGMIGAESKFIGDSREIAYEIGNVTKETNGLLTSFEKIEQSTKQTGFDRDAFQESYMKNLKSGLRNQKDAQKVAIAQLNTEKQLGLSAGDLNETFREFATAGRMSTVQISTMGMGMRNVARNTGLTGEALKSAITASKTFVDNLRNAAQLSSSSATNVTELTANFQKLGVSDVGGEINKYLTSGTQVLLEGSSQTATFLYMAAASAGKVAELQQGTLTKSKEGIKSLAAGMEQVLKNFGVQSLEAIDQIPDEVKTTLNLQLKTVTGMELGQLRSVIEAAKETGKTFSDRLQDINKKREQGVTIEERMALAEEERRLKVSKSLDILTALDESAKGAADMSMALSTFGKRSKDFEKDVQAMGGTFGSGIEAARVSISTSIEEINKGLLKAGKKELKIDLSEIEDSLNNPMGLRELVSKIQAGERELATAQKAQLDPARATQQQLIELNDQIRGYSNSALGYMKKLVGEVGFMTIAIGTIAATSTIGAARSFDTILSSFSKKKGAAAAPKPDPAAGGSFLSKLLGGLGIGGTGTGTPPVPPIVPPLPAPLPAPPLTPPVPPIGANKFGVGLMSNALILTGMVVGLAALATALVLITGIMIKKFDLKPEEILAGTAAITIMMIGLAAIMGALALGFKNQDKQGITAPVIGNIAKQSLGLIIIAALMTTLSGVLVTFGFSLMKMVKEIIKSFDIKAGDGFKAATQIADMLLLAGALIGVIGALISIPTPTGGIKGLLPKLGVLAAIGALLYFAGPMIVKFIVSLTNFVKSGLDKVKINPNELLTMAGKLAAIAAVSGVVIGAMYGLSMVTTKFSGMSTLSGFSQITIRTAAKSIGMATLAAFLLGGALILATKVLDSLNINISDIIRTSAMITAVFVGTIIIMAAFLGGVSLITSMASAIGGGAAAGTAATFGLLPAGFLTALGVAAVTILIAAGTAAVLGAALWGASKLLGMINLDLGSIIYTAAIITTIFLATTIITVAFLLGALAITTLAAGGVGFAAMAVTVPAAGWALLAAGGAAVVLGLALMSIAWGMKMVGLDISAIMNAALQITAIFGAAFLIGASFLLAALGLSAIISVGSFIPALTFSAAISLGLSALGIAALAISIVAFNDYIKDIDISAFNDSGKKLTEIGSAMLVTAVGLTMLSAGVTTIAVSGLIGGVMGLLASAVLFVVSLAVYTLSKGINSISSNMESINVEMLKNLNKKMKALSSFLLTFSTTLTVFMSTAAAVLAPMLAGAAIGGAAGGVVGAIGGAAIGAAITFGGPFLLANTITFFVDNMMKVVTGIIDNENFKNFSSNVDTAAEKLKGISKVLGYFAEALATMNGSLMSNLNDLTGSSLQSMMQSLFSPFKSTGEKINQFFIIFKDLMDQIVKTPVDTAKVSVAKQKMSQLSSVLSPFAETLDNFSKKLLPLFQSTWFGIGPSQIQSFIADGKRAVDGGQIGQVGNVLSDLTNQIVDNFSVIRATPQQIEKLSPSIKLASSFAELLEKLGKTVGILFGSVETTMGIFGVNYDTFMNLLPKFNEKLPLILPPIQKMVEVMSQLTIDVNESSMNKLKKFKEAFEVSLGIFDMFTEKIVPLITKVGDGAKEIKAFTDNAEFNKYKENLDWLLGKKGETGHLTFVMGQMIESFSKAFEKWETPNLSKTYEKMLIVSKAFDVMSKGILEFVKIIPALMDPKAIDALKKMKEQKAEESPLFMFSEIIIKQMAEPISKAGLSGEKLLSALSILAKVAEFMPKLPAALQSFLEIVNGPMLSEVTKALQSSVSFTGGTPISTPSLGEQLASFIKFIDENLIGNISNINLSDAEDSIDNITSVINILTKSMDLMDTMKSMSNKLGSEYKVLNKNGKAQKVSFTEMFKQFSTEGLDDYSVHNEYNAFYKGMEGFFANFVEPLSKILSKFESIDLESAASQFEDISKMMVSAGNFAGGMEAFNKSIDKITKIPPDAGKKISDGVASVANLVSDDLIKTLTNSNPKLEILADLMSDFADLFADIKESNASIVLSATDLAKTTLSPDMIQALSGNLSTYYELGKVAAAVTGNVQVAAVPAAQGNPLVATNQEKASQVANATTTPAGAAVVQEENSEPILDTLISISESINSFLSIAARGGGGGSIVNGSNVPFIPRIGVDPKLGRRINGDIMSGDSINGTYTG